MTMHRHPQAAATARYMVDDFDGGAEKMVERAIDRKLDEEDVDEALRLDQVRREIGHIYEIEGK